MMVLEENAFKVPSYRNKNKFQLTDSMYIFLNAPWTQVYTDMGNDGQDNLYMTLLEDVICDIYESVILSFWNNLWNPNILVTQEPIQHFYKL